MQEDEVQAAASPPLTPRNQKSSMHRIPNQRVEPYHRTRKSSHSSRKVAMAKSVMQANNNNDNNKATKNHKRNMKTMMMIKLVELTCNAV